MTMADPHEDADSQDMAEIFDETNTTLDGVDIAHPDVARDVYDVTSVEDDADEDQPVDLDDFDPDQVDEVELEMMLEEDDGVDAPRMLELDEADLVSLDDPSPADYQGVTTSPSARRIQEDRRDADLDASFPASDPPSASPGAT
jgi:hypothetical protein